MSNQPQSRPWFRISSVARAPQPQAPTPAAQPARPQTQAPAPLPRPALMRPAFRPPGVTQPPPAQEPAPPPRAPAPTPSVPSAQPRPSPSVTFGASSQPFRPPITTTLAPRTPAAAPLAAPAPPPPVSTTLAPRAPASTPIAARSPPSPPPLTTSMAPRMPAPPPVGAPSLTTTLAPRTPASPVSQKSPPGPSSLPSPPKTQTPPFLPSSPAVSRSLSASLKSSSPSSAPKVRAISPPKPSSPVQAIAPSMPYSSPTPSNRSFTARVPSPGESPRAAKPFPETPPQSSQNPYFAPPPFTLPPSQLNSDGEGGPKIPAETEKKTVLVQEAVGKPQSFLQSCDSGSQKTYNGTTVKPKQRDFYKKFSDSEDGSIRVITIGGDNKGAVMELGYSPRRLGSGSSLNSPHTIRSDTDVSEGKLSDSEGKSKLQGNVHNATTKPSAPMHAFMNSNVQGINSSIVFNSSCSHHDAGVHLSLTRTPMNGHKNHAKEKGQWFSN